MQIHVTEEELAHLVEWNKSQAKLAGESGRWAEAAVYANRVEELEPHTRKEDDAPTTGDPRLP